MDGHNLMAEMTNRKPTGCGCWTILAFVLGLAIGMFGLGWYLSLWTHLGR